MHDALADAAGRLLASGDLPPSGGTPATVLLTLSLEQLETRTGLVTTAHGGTISVTEALRFAGEANVIPVVLDSTGILASAWPAAPRRSGNASPSQCGTRDVASPAAMLHRAGRKCITSSNGSKAAAPTSTTNASSAATTTANTRNAAGR
jgi:hypothetical protein